jgi:hypothetical protein
MTGHLWAWKKGSVLIGLFLCIAFCMQPVAAVTTTTITAQDVSQYSITASQDHYIYQIRIDSLPMGTNQTHILNSNGAVFLLEIGTYQEYAIYNNFDVSMTYPNGTKETIHKLSTRISDGSYTTTIQPVFAQITGTTPAWKIDLNIGTNPTTVMFTPNNILEFDPETSIPFTSATGEFSGQTTTVYGYEILKQEFADEITNYNPWGSVSNYIGQVFAWAWENVLAFINQIPFIGPQFIIMMTWVYTVGAQIIFWLTYIAFNLMLIIAGGEILLIVFAFLLAGKRPTPERFVKNLVNYNVRSVKGFLWIVGLLYEWLRSFVETVAHIIAGIRPL